MVITVATQKGGTGKTSTAVILAQAAAHKGKDVLLIDTDPQGNATFANGGKMNTNGAFEFITGTSKYVTHPISARLDLIPASANLSTLSTDRGTARRLQTAIAPIKDKYDYIFVDTQPTSGELQYNAIMCADGVIIPLLADAFSIQALHQIARTIATIRESKPSLRVLGVIFTMYDGRSTLAKQMREMITEDAEKMGVPVLGTIRAGVAVKEAACLQKSLYEYAGKSHPAQDYLNIFDAIDKGQK